MKIPRDSLCAVVVLVATASLFAADALTVSVSSATDKSYYRVKQEDGSFAPELYVIANGGKFPGTTRDSTFDKVTYPQVAGLVGQQLARQNYFLAPKAKDASLLVVIYWGETIPFGGLNPQDPVQAGTASLDAFMSQINAIRAQQTGNKVSGLVMAANGRIPVGSANATDSRGEAYGPPRPDDGLLDFALTQMQSADLYRDKASEENARLLGYTDAINERRELPAWADVAGLAQELRADIEEARYYVVVAAYDFKVMKEKQRKVLRWVTRISVGSRGNEFDKCVAQMLASASDAFGQGGGLRRRHFGDGKVILGETKYLGEATAEDLKPAATPTETK
jgi:hypothetical protein